MGPPARASRVVLAGVPPAAMAADLDDFFVHLAHVDPSGAEAAGGRKGCACPRCRHARAVTAMEEEVDTEIEEVGEGADAAPSAAASASSGAAAAAAAAAAPTTIAAARAAGAGGGPPPPPAAAPAVCSAAVAMFGAEQGAKVQAEAQGRRGRKRG
jgi:hypothetical protein